MSLLLLITYVICIFFSRIILRSWINPLTIFLSIWLTIVALYQLRLSSYQYSLDNRTYLTFFVMFFSFAVAFFLCVLVTGQIMSKHRNFLHREMTYKTITRLFGFWALGSMLEIVYSRGVPIIWRIVGSSRSYFDFGIPSVHGFLNALGLSLICIIFYHIKTLDFGKKSKLKLYFFGMIAYYCVILTRQILISAAIELAIVSFILARKKFHIIMPVVTIFGGIFIFGVLGNLRTGYSEFLRVSGISLQLPEFFSGFYWVYMYLTMTISNINNMISLSPNATNLGMAFVSFLPTVLQKMFFPNSVLIGVGHSILVNPAFNVSGFFTQFYLVAGILGVIIISIVYGGLAGFSYCLYSKIPSEKNILLYAVVLQIVILSFFDNLLFDLPNVFQIVIILVLYYSRRELISEKRLVNL